MHAALCAVVLCRDSWNLLVRDGGDWNLPAATAYAKDIHGPFVHSKQVALRIVKDLRAEHLVPLMDWYITPKEICRVYRPTVPLELDLDDKHFVRLQLPPCEQKSTMDWNAFRIWRQEIHVPGDRELKLMAQVAAFTVQSQVTEFFMRRFELFELTGSGFCVRGNGRSLDRLRQEALMPPGLANASPLCQLLLKQDPGSFKYYQTNKLLAFEEMDPDGNTPLHCAVATRNYDFVRRFHNDFDMKQCNVLGLHPAHVAIMLCDVEMSKQFLPHTKTLILDTIEGDLGLFDFALLQKLPYAFLRQVFGEYWYRWSHIPEPKLRMLAERLGVEQTLSGVQ